VWDGEKDGVMYCILGVNRIACAADLDPIVEHIPYNAWKNRLIENPGEPVEKIALVCMGHEADLAAQFKRKLGDMGKHVEIQVRDILRDRSDIQLKRDSDALVVREGGNIIIKKFYPNDLLNKLSLDDTVVDDWRQLADSVKIDFNYDGAVFKPTVVDSPEKGGLVSGIYKLPADSGTIRVKITDLLSESLELEV
jgi:hypothetical protein